MIWRFSLKGARKSAGGERGWGGAKNAISSVLLLLLFSPRPLHGKSPNHEPARLLCLLHEILLAYGMPPSPPPHSSFSLLSNARTLRSPCSTQEEKSGIGAGRKMPAICSGHVLARNGGIRCPVSKRRSIRLVLGKDWPFITIYYTFVQFSSNSLAFALHKSAISIPAK